MVTITHAAGPRYRRSSHGRRTKEERFTLAYVLADRTIFWLRNFLKNSASNRCSAAWGPPRISWRKVMKRGGLETEEESKTNMRVQERVSHVYAWGKSSQSTLLTFIALTFTITAFKSTGPPCVCVCTCVFNVSEVWLHSELFPQKSITDEDTDKGHPSYYEQDINDALGWNDNTLLLMTFKLKQSITIWSHSHIDHFIQKMMRWND